MLGSKLMTKVSAALCVMKDSTNAFGGMNITFAGDFAQLPPVGDSKLFSHLQTSSSTEAALQHVQGKLLWLSVDTVVVLTEVMQQGGSENTQFVDLLSRLHSHPDWNLPEWRNALLIVSENAVKDAYNDHAAHTYVARNGRLLHYYYSLD
ncbi:hypothetical protein ARMGADRAFT_860313, partial [Armillaria gallica]